MEPLRSLIFLSPRRRVLSSAAGREQRHYRGSNCSSCSSVQQGWAILLLPSWNIHNSIQQFCKLIAYGQYKTILQPSACRPRPRSQSSNSCSSSCSCRCSPPNPRSRRRNRDNSSPRSSHLRPCSSCSSRSYRRSNR